MIRINKTSHYIKLTYSYGEITFSFDDWVTRELKKVGFVWIKHRIFKLTPELVDNQSRLKIKEGEFIENYPDITFNIGELMEMSKEGFRDDYYKIYRGVLLNDRDVYLHQDIECHVDIFVAETDISVFRQIANLVQGDIIIGGNFPESVPLEEFYMLIKNFPNTYEKKLYAQSRISAVLKNYFENVKDSESLYKKYRNRQISAKGVDLLRLFEDYESDKFQTIYDKLALMLERGEDYNETQWQKEIIDILILLYPKYIAVFKEVPINADDTTHKFLDFLFIDAYGHVDIVEIKQPFNNAIMTKGKYRDNYIPLRELSGTVMQLEKYIFYLNRWGTRGEKYLSQKYKDRLPKDFSIQITNPKGFIIMGRDNNLTRSQKRDFEVVKRKYSNVIDILTYDDLLQRLKLSIEQIKLI